MSDIDPLFILIVTRYTAIFYKSKSVLTYRRHNKLCLAPLHGLSIIVMQGKHNLTPLRRVSHYINTIGEPRGEIKHTGRAESTTTVPRDAPFRPGGGAGGLPKRSHAFKRTKKNVQSLQTDWFENSGREKVVILFGISSSANNNNF